MLDVMKSGQHMDLSAVTAIKPAFVNSDGKMPNAAVTSVDFCTISLLKGDALSEAFVALGERLRKVVTQQLRAFTSSSELHVDGLPEDSVNIDSDFCTLLRRQFRGVC